MLKKHKKAEAKDTKMFSNKKLHHEINMMAKTKGYKKMLDVYESVLKHKHAKIDKKNSCKHDKATSDTELVSDSNNLVNVIKSTPQKQKKICILLRLGQI